MKSTYGLGAIDTYPTRGGERHRARLPNGAGGYRTLGSFGTREEAEGALRGAVAAEAEGTVRPDTETLRTFGERFLRRRKAAGQKNGKTDRSRWDLHVMGALFADWPIAAITPTAVASWIDTLGKCATSDRRGARPLSAQTIKHVVTLLRRALDRARLEGLVTENAAAKQELPKISARWTYLAPQEIDRLTTCPAIPRVEQLVIAVAIGTGLRVQEQWDLRLVDVHIEDGHPWLYVREGKGGKSRRVEVFGLALTAFREYLTLLPTWVKRNPLGLAFPTQRGCRRRESKPPRGWASWLKAAGLGDASKRHDGEAVHWHVLRHTCGSALVSGWWGRAWRLEEVQSQLGHSSRTTTERYAHLAPSVVAEAARGTTGGSSVQSRATQESAPSSNAYPPEFAEAQPANNLPEGSANSSAPQWIRTTGLRLRRPSQSDEFREVASDAGRFLAGPEDLAIRVLRAAASGDPLVVRYAVALAEAVLDAAPSLDAGGERGAG